MQQLDRAQLAAVVGGESFGDMARALKPALDVPASQTYQASLDFIRDHPFFHQGVMNAPIGGGKHFRNVPFVGPTEILKGAAHLDATAIKKGAEITRATWDAP